MEKRKVNVGTIKDWLQVVAIVVAATWAIWKFIYEDRILPERIPPHVIMTSEMQKIGTKNSMTAIRVNVNINNTSHRKVYALSSWYHVAGSKIEGYSLDDTTFADAIEAKMNGKDGGGRIPRYFYDKDFEVIEAGALLDKGWWFEAGEEVSKSFVIFVPEGEYDLLRFWADIDVAKNTEPFVEKWEVKKGVLLNPLIYLKLDGFEEDSARVELYYPLGKHKELQEKYSLVHTKTYSELSLW